MIATAIGAFCLGLQSLHNGSGSSSWCPDASASFLLCLRANTRTPPLYILRWPGPLQQFAFRLAMASGTAVRSWSSSDARD